MPAWRYFIFHLIPSASLLIFGSVSVVADEIYVAVASNFTEPMKQLTQLFQQSSGHQVIVSVGSTRQLYSQIKNGGPFQIFLSADLTHPQKLVAEELAVKGTVFIYAIGKLVLWSQDAHLIDAEGKVLKIGQFNHLALANPKTAPYGMAAQQTLKRLGLWQTLQNKLVQGNNITQAYQFIATGNAELGFIALSQYQAVTKESPGSHWLVPESLYEAILQGAVLLKTGENNLAAKAFIAFLGSPQARPVIESYGYVVP